MALRSAWELQRYFAPVSREWRSGMSSRTPRGKPLNPVDLISLSGPTITAPTRRPLSLLQWAIWWASIMKRWSQVLENIRYPRSQRLALWADDDGRLQIGGAGTNRRMARGGVTLPQFLAPTLATAGMSSRGARKQS